MRRSLASLFFASALSVAPLALAQGSARDLAAAEVLFREAQRLYDDGDYPAACAKFSASYDLDAGLGTLLNLARCWEKAGRTASAWAAYVDLSALSKRAGQTDRAAIADERIAALEPALMRLRLRVHADVPVEVSLDDEPVAPELFDTALPVDPGQHRVAARRPNDEVYFSRTVTVSAEGETVELDIEPPPPRPAPPPPAPVPPSPVALEPPVPPTTPPAEEDADRTAWWIAGGVTGGVGLVALGVSAGFTADAASSWSDAGCENGLCPNADAQALSEQAGRSADVATGVGIAGGLLAATGAVLILVGALGGEEHVTVSARGLAIRF